MRRRAGPRRRPPGPLPVGGWHERRPAAAARRARRHPPGRHRQGRGPGRSSIARSSSTRDGAGCSARARRSRRSATPPRSGSARRSRAAPRPTARRSRSSRRRRSRPASGSPPSTPSWPTIEAELDDLLLRIPNPADPDVPVGGEEANVTVRTWGEILAHEEPLEGEVGADAPAGGATWTRKPHWELGEALDIIDNARGAKIAGSGFPVYKGAGSALQRGLISWFLDVHTRENGFTEVWPPAVVNTASATGHRPDPGQGRPDVRRHPRRAVPGPDGRGPGHEPAPRRDPRGGRAADPLRRLHARASAARPAPPARTPAGSCASTSSTRSRWCCSSGPRTRRPRSSG